MRRRRRAASSRSRSARKSKLVCDELGVSQLWRGRESDRRRSPMTAPTEGARERRMCRSSTMMGRERGEVKGGFGEEGAVNVCG